MVEYCPPTSETCYRHVTAVRSETTTLSDDEEITDDVPAVADFRVLTTVDPPED